MDPNRKDNFEPNRFPRREVPRRAWWKGLPGLLVLLLLLVTLPTAFCVGIIAGTLLEAKRQYQAKFERDAAVIAPVLAADPASSRVTIHKYSAGGVELWGSVATPADGRRLRAEFVRPFGETVVWRIEVEVQQTGQSVSELGKNKGVGSH